MKKKLTICLMVLAFPMMQLLAQDTDTSMHRLPAITVVSSANVTQAVKRAFEKSFVDVENLVWYKKNKDFLAKFFVDDMDHNALYRKNGSMKYDVSYGYEKNLPTDVRAQVKSEYGKFEISRVFNVKVYDRDIWLVNLEGPKNYLVIRVEDGQLEELDKLAKAR